MTDERLGSRLADLLRPLQPKAKQPVSATVLNNWIAHAEGKLGEEARGGRLGWLVASPVAIAAVQRAIDVDGRQLFLLKGGTLLQHRLNATARSTKDVDGLIRGDLDEFLRALEVALAEPWGPLTLRRGAIDVVNVPTKIIKPRRFDVILELRGVTWRRVQFEVSPDEAGIGEDQEAIEPPPLDGFGLPNPNVLVGIAMRFQIAQSFTLSPTRTDHRMRSTIGRVTSSTFFCYETSSPQPEARPSPSCERQRWPSSRHDQGKPGNSACRGDRGRRP